MKQKGHDNLEHTENKIFNDIHNADENKQNFTIEELAFKNIQRQYIYSPTEDSQIVFVLKELSGFV